MSVRIELDNTHQGVYTCLDYVSGNVILNLPSDDTISSITVKMEGISRTRLEPPRLEGALADAPREKRRAEVEIHKLLYVVDTVFPSNDIRDATSKAGFTLRAGQHVYPFRIRVPINSSCTKGVASGAIAGGLLQKVSFDINKVTVDYARDASRHIKGTLPPSLSGITDDVAWIKYFLKVTVNRPQFYKTNMRQHEPFVFLPIEPPRPPPSNAESFARRKHEFITVPPTPKSKGLFSVFGSKNMPPPSPLIPCRFSVEARLPSPPILVPNEPLPLRILITKLDPFKDALVMRMIQITLLANTFISAHELYKDELSTHLLLSIADMHVPFVDVDAPVNVPIEMNPHMWRDRAVPDHVAPTFVTCNIKRSYQLKIEIGLSRADEEHYDVISLIHNVEVYSGIKPPKQLAMSAIQPPSMPPRPGNTEKAKSSLAIPGLPPFGHKIERKASSTDVKAGSSSAPPPLPQRPHSSHNTPTAQSDSGYNDYQGDAPPPTYEDAMADSIAPVDGPRRRYQQGATYYHDVPDDLR
ncbi:hypothetical protein FPQ18DRAFT_300577 [Pyronema domesticum]|nr:hypothetical protein FPQ18DRAFT_300577 [Pyronema domesticum]